MAKTRAQRKAERRKRQAQLEREGLSPEEAQQAAGERDQESRAQHDTQVPQSGEEASHDPTPLSPTLTRGSITAYTISRTNTVSARR